MEPGGPLLVGLAIAAVLLLVVLALYFAKSSAAPPMQVAYAEDYDCLQVIVMARDKEAELEVCARFVPHASSTHSPRHNPRPRVTG